MHYRIVSNSLIYYSVNVTATGHETFFSWPFGGSRGIIVITLEDINSEVRLS